MDKILMLTFLLILRPIFTFLMYIAFDKLFVFLGFENRFINHGC